MRRWATRPSRKETCLFAAWAAWAAVTVAAGAFPETAPRAGDDDDDCMPPSGWERPGASESDGVDDSIRASASLVSCSITANVSSRSKKFIKKYCPDFRIYLKKCTIMTCTSLSSIVTMRMALAIMPPIVFSFESDLISLISITSLVSEPRMKE